MKEQKHSFTKAAQAKLKDLDTSNILKQHSNTEEAAQVPGALGMTRTLPSENQSQECEVLSVPFITISVTAVKTAL